MAVSLASLRVTSEFDAAGYVRGAQQKVAADQQMIASDKARNAGLAQVDAALAKAIPGMTSISKSLLEGYGAGQQFEAMIRRVGNAVDRGMGLDRANVLLESAYRRFGLTADAAQLAERGFVLIAPSIDALNAKYAVHADLAARVTARTEALARAQQFQASLNGLFGIDAAPATTQGAGYDALNQQMQQAEQRAAALRAALNPLDAEFAKLGKEIAQYRTMLRDGLITQQEFEGAQLLAGKRLSDFEKNLKNGANAGRVMSGEITNLGYQLNDVITGLSLGQSPFMILGQQGGQIFQIFQNSKASVADFGKEIGGRLVNAMTASRVAWLGTASAIGIAALALNDYLSKQEKVAMGLTGAGRASGASITSINAAANAGSSLTGLSVSEARNLATALAVTGKVANDNILPIVQMGKDIAHAFGVDAAGATELLAKAFSDPAAGMDTLNHRLGFLDAAMKQQISNLIAQNKLWDAQKVLQAGAASSLKDVNEAVGTSTKFWTAIGNLISNTWDSIGEGAARATGIGLRLGLDEQLSQARQRLEELQAIASRRSQSANNALGTTDAIDKQKAKVDELTAAWDRYGRSQLEAQQRQFSFAQAGAVRAELPELDQLDRLRNAQDLLVRTMIDVEASGGRSSEILKRMGVSYDELGRAVAGAAGNYVSFKNEFSQSMAALRLGYDAVMAFSPGAKAEIARRQSLESTISAKMSPAEKALLAEQAYQNALKTSNTMLSEAARERLLAATQGVKSAQVEIDIMGKSIGETYRLRTEEQTRQQLEQEAARNRTKIDQEHLNSLNEQIKRTSLLKQAEAERALRADAAFDRSQIGLTDQEQQINAKLRAVYGDGYATNAAAQMDKEMLRLNANLRMTSDVGRDAFGGIVKDMVAGKSAADALNTAIGKIEDKLIQMTIDNVWSTAFGGTGGSGFNWGSLFNGGSGSTPTMSTGLGAGTGGLAFPTFHGGGIVGMEGAMRFVHPAHFNNAPKFHTGIGPGERAAVLQDNEGVFTQGQMRALGLMAGGSRGAPGSVTVNVIGAPAGTTATARTKSGSGGLTIDVMLRQIEDGIARNVNGGQSPLNSAMETRYGLDPTRGVA